MPHYASDTDETWLKRVLYSVQVERWFCFLVCCFVVVFQATPYPKGIGFLFPGGLNKTSSAFPWVILSCSLTSPLICSQIFILLCVAVCSLMSMHHYLFYSLHEWCHAHLLIWILGTSSFSDDSSDPFLELCKHTINVSSWIASKLWAAQWRFGQQLVMNTAGTIL